MRAELVDLNHCAVHFLSRAIVNLYHLKLKNMREELANPNHCAVLFLSRAAVNLSWYDSALNLLEISVIPIDTSLLLRTEA